MAVAPDLNFMFPAKFRLDHFATNCGRRFFPSAILGAVRAVNVMITRHARVPTRSLRENAGTSVR